LIARLDLPLGIGETQAWDDYITRAHNPQFVKVSRQTTTRDLGKLFADRIGGSGSGVVGPPHPPSSTSCSSSSAVSELSAYLDSDCVTAYDDDFDILLWWRDHKLTYPILSIMARDIMSVPVSTVSSESCFSLTGRILEERRRCLLPKNVEMLTCIKDWELGARREQHEAEDTELEEAFKNLFLDDEGAGGSGAVS